MKTSMFEHYMLTMEKQTVETLRKKAEEYAAGGDRLHNFRAAAQLQGVTLLQALGGMMVKHTVSVYDLIADGKPHAPALWAEKIGDHINYLYLLWAAVMEETAQAARNDEDVDPLDPNDPRNYPEG